MKKTLQFLFSKIWLYDRAMIPIILVFSLLYAVYPFVWLAVPKIIIDQAVLGKTTPIILASVAGGVIAGLSVLFTNFLRGNYRMRMNTVRYYLIRDLLNASLQMPYEMTLDPKVLDDIHSIQFTVTNPREGAGSIILLFLQIFGGFLASIGLIGLMSTLSVWMMLVMLLIVIFTFILQNKADQFQEEQWEKQYPEYRKFEGIMDFSIDPSNGKDIRLYGLFPVLKKYADESNHRLLMIFEAVQKKKFNALSGIALLNLIRDGLLYSWLLVQFLSNRLIPSDFYLYTTGITAFIVFLQESMKNMASIKRESAKFRKYLDFIERINEKTQFQKEEEEKSRRVMPDQAPSLELKNVTFSYPGAGKPVIDNLNLSIAPGQKLALVGENGAGKSTLIKLICRLYRPDSGQILLDGIPVEAYSETEYRKRLSVVFQDAMIFPFSLSENITLQKKPDQAGLKSAMEKSGIWDDVADLPRKEQTTLLRILDDNGIDLSGGQRQKMFLARALYKNGSIILLDEPSAALDPLAEYELYRKYDELTRERTSIYISHRLASTRFCDRIALLKDGCVRELGTHEDLMRLNGEYAKLFRIQAKYYVKHDTEAGKDLEELYG